MDYCFKHHMFNSIITTEPNPIFVPVPVPVPKPKYIIKDRTLLIPYNYNEKLDLECEELEDINTLIFDENRNEGKKFNV